MPAHRPLAPWAHRMWSVIRRHPEWNLDAFCAFIVDRSPRGVSLDRTIVCMMMNGKRKTDANLLPILAEYLGPDGPRLVFGPFLREIGLDPTLLAPEPEEQPASLVELTLQVQATAGQLAARALQATSPASPGGLRVVGAEWAQLADTGRELRELADQLDRLAAAHEDAA